MTRARETLGLDGDDTVDLLHALEDAFGVRIADDEAAACETVADVMALIAARAPEKGGACMTAMAFYRLRRGMGGAVPREALRPETDLRPFTNGNARRFLARLAGATGLKMPPAEGRRLTTLGVLFVLGGLIGAPVAAATALKTWWMLPVAAGLCVAGGALIRLDPGALSADTRTMRGLAGRFSVLNYGRLSKQGGAIRGDERERALVTILSDFADLSPDEIRPEMRVLAESPKAA